MKKVLIVFFVLAAMQMLARSAYVMTQEELDSLFKKTILANCHITESAYDKGFEDTSLELMCGSDASHWNNYVISALNSFHIAAQQQGEYIRDFEPSRLKKHSPREITFYSGGKLVSLHREDSSKDNKNTTEINITAASSVKLDIFTRGGGCRMDYRALLDHQSQRTLIPTHKKPGPHGQHEYIDITPYLKQGKSHLKVQFRNLGCGSPHKHIGGTAASNFEEKVTLRANNQDIWACDLQKEIAGHAEQPIFTCIAYIRKD
ncbi:hypothetical protein ACFL6Y_10560 [Elusimicrobiota bacterium]